MKLKTVLGASIYIAGFLVFEPAGAMNRVVTADSCLNLRSKATSNSRAKQCLETGTQLKVLKTKGKYSYVEANGRKGWVFNRYTKDAPVTRKEGEPIVYRSAARTAPPSEPSSVPPLGGGSVGGGPGTPPLSSMLTGSVAPDAMSNPSPGIQVASLGSDESLADVLTPNSLNQGPGAPNTLNAGEANDISSLMLNVAKSVGKEDIGYGNGYTLNSPVGWAQLQSDGSISGVKGKKSHCTSATHAAFLKTIGTLSKDGLVKLSPEALKALNSTTFRDAWNSNGYGPAALIENLGGQNFKDLSQARPGDIMKLDRKNGSGHMTIFSHVQGNRICYWTSNKKTRGVQDYDKKPHCESMDRMKGYVFSRITDVAALQRGLDNLGSYLAGPEMAQVRRKGGNANVALGSFTGSPATPAALAQSGIGLYIDRKPTASQTAALQ